MAFVREHTELAPVPLVPEIRLFTATAVTPLWHATEAWLGARGIEAPFWSVPWAGGQGLARFVLDRPETVRGRRVLDLGAGSGLVAIACVLAGAIEVEAVDVDPFAEAACLLNAEANGCTLRVATRDVVDDGGAGGAEVILAGDVWYDRAVAARLGPWLDGAARRGARVLTGDPGRLHVPVELPSGIVERARVEVPTSQDLESVATRTCRVLEIGAGEESR